MSSFFEKLKKGMGTEAPNEQELTKEEIKGEIPPAAREKPEKREVKRKKKLKIESIPPSKSEKSNQKEEKIEIKKKKWFEPEGQLSIDVYQTNGELVVQSAIAGVKAEDLDISIENDLITIRGKREKPEEEERNYFYQECYWGPFSREIILPVEVDPSRVKASMKEGILTLRLPKIQREKKRKIRIKTE